MTEVWRPVPSAPQWEASSWGRVRRVPEWSEARQRFYGGRPIRGGSASGKLQVTDKRRQYAVHRLVCEAFHGSPPPGKPLCMHLDEDFRNNRPENLAWGTQSENMNAPRLRAWWTPERHAAARAKGWETRRRNLEKQT